MFNRSGRNDVDDDVDDVQSDISQLADSLEAVLKSWGDSDSDEADAARRKAKALLRESRARMHGRSMTHQAAREAVGCAGSYVRSNPWQTLGVLAAVGIIIGALSGACRCR